ncbi:Succinate semialdehyde dehydrogenase [NAD(P)+] Sad [Pseudoclavibacter triregionum]|nr:Succinate semialdehyde dehydrogenase [NAD(P)+] Sad [Pseudoclavibacter triregionum]
MTGYAVTNPSTGEVEQTFPDASDAEIQDAIAAAFDAYRQWSRSTTAEERAQIIRRVGELHNERLDELSAIIVREMGKPIEQVKGEVEFSAAIYEYYADNGPGLLKDEPIEAAAGGYAVIRKDPIGPLLGIMPWNFPYYQVARFAGPNVVAGNPILLKHAEQCPESALAIQQIFKDAGAPEGVYTNLFATHEQCSAIIADPRVRGVSLTGSERAGAIIAEQAGRALKKVVLELGGSDPFIVLDTDDMDRTVEMAVAGRMENSGQACNASKRVIVLDGLYDEFVEKYTAAMTGQKIAADPMQEGSDMGPLSSVKAAERLEEQVKAAVAEGAQLASGGERDGARYPGGVLTGITPEMDAYREELFGPVGQVYRAKDVDEAIRIANDSPYGLGSVVITQDEQLALDVASRLETGMVFINEVGGDSAELPFGGVKNSGFGRELGTLGIQEFLNRKLIRFKDKSAS